MKPAAFFMMTLTYCLLVIVLVGTGCKKKDINLPVVHSEGIRDATTNTAMAGGWITDDGGGEVQDCGVCWSETPSPTVGDNIISAGTGTGTFMVTVTGLTANTLYYLRTYATNEEGTAYGEEMFMKTMTGSVTDIDGNVYPTVMIGSQEWMAKNLAVTHYRNGESIAQVTDATSWEETESGAYCWYENDYPNYGQYYGALYNWYSLIDSRNICPVGWHIPTIEEWNTLFDYLGSTLQITTKLKSAVTDNSQHHVAPPYWDTYNGGATNETGFSGFGAGWRTPDGKNFEVLCLTAKWWSISIEDTGGLGVWITSDNYMSPNQLFIWSSGLSVRCVKD